MSFNHYFNNKGQASNLLLVTNKFERPPMGGRQMLCKLNHDALYHIYGRRLTLLEVEKKPFRCLFDIMYGFRVYIDGVNAGFINSVINAIKFNKIDCIFVDGSNFGEIVKCVKKIFPNIYVLTFFHNVEARFFWGSLRQSMTCQSLAVLYVNYLAEKKSTKFSDKVICLNNRDSQLLGKIYGRSATHISEIALHDTLPPNFQSLVIHSQQRYILFVGGDFYANRVGITWFVKNVASKIAGKVCIVGKGLERYKDELEIVDNVQVLGAVDSLAEWYLNAQFVIAPIFDGSGMKTKVAEALMHGKKVIGTAEAFSGYEEVADRAGVVCNAADEFIRAIADTNKMDLADFAQDLRYIYEKKYSFEAAKERFMNILDFKS